VSKIDAFYPHFIAAYDRDTKHLNTLQHGAYRLLMDAAWVCGGRLPDDPRQLMQITKIQPEQWGKNWSVLKGFFTPELGGEGQKLLLLPRMAEEREKALAISEKRRAAGRGGGRPPKANGSVLRSQMQTHAGGMRDRATLPSEDIGKKETPSEPPKKDVAQPTASPGSKGTRLPMIWFADEANRAYAAELGFSDDEITEMEIDFTTWWPAQPGQKGVKTDWGLTWKTWVRTERKRRDGRATAAENKARDRIANHQRALRTPAAHR
jgi:uncharacterized protein YdaU (DUF1376 family)